jgi:D-glycerate 3-kinase
MKLAGLLDRLTSTRSASLAPQQRRTEQVLAALPADAPEDWRQLAAALAVQECAQGEAEGRVRVLGISGGQGAGKSTLAALLVQAGEMLGKRAVALSLDDFYLTQAERQALAANTHPLLATRGVPGTHDVAMACTVLDALVAGQPCQVPLFDKSVDDRKSIGRMVSDQVDLVVFEGWCVGVQAEPAAQLAAPINDLERLEDRDAVWRHSVNDALTVAYPALWGRLDRLLYLQVPDLAAVIRWRTEQEQSHPPERRMAAVEIERFVAHYERLTRWMSASLVDEADLVGFLDKNHQLADLTVR